MLEVVGNVNAVPEHIGAICVKVGVAPEFTLTVIVVVFAHSPEVGIKVYVLVDIKVKAGDQVPVIPLFDVVGKVNVFPEQTGPTCVKVGVTFGLTTIVNVTGLAHGYKVLFEVNV